MEEIDQQREAADMLARNRVDLSGLVELSHTEAAAAVGEAMAEGKSHQYFEDSLYANDPSQPLANPRYEAYCCARAGGIVAHAAYHANVSPRGTVQTASQQASRMERRADVRARLRWLITEHQKATRRAAVGGEEAPAGVETGVSRKTKMRLLEAILKDSTVAVTDRIRAMEQHNRLAAEEAGDQKRGLADLDPVEVCEIFRQASEQGIDPEEWAKRQKDPQQVVCPVPEEGPKPENVEKAGESE